jgi:predicted metal-binding protein
LEPEDAPALIEAAERYAASSDGNLPGEAMPAVLGDKVSLRVSPLRAA